MVKKTRRQRFFDKVAYKEEGCWEWQAGKNGDGYGIFLWATENGQRVQTTANKASYLLFKGPIPPGMYVCHSCDNPGCVNPKHLWLGTAVENARDRDGKGRASTGNRTGTSKLTPEDIQALRYDKKAGFTLSQLSEKYSVSATYAGMIARNEVFN